MTIKTHQSGVENPTTIVFLHGLGVSSWMWHDQIESLQTNYHCIAIDLPGNGESYQAHWDSFTQTADQISDIIRQEAHNGRAHIVALSLGGYVGLHLLSQHPDIVQSMIVSGVTPSPLLKQKWLIPPLSKLLSRMLKWHWLGRLSAKMMQFPEEVVPIYMRDLDRLSSEMVRRCYNEVLNFQLPPIEQIDARKLLVTGGDKEAKAILSGFNEFSEKLPQCTIAQATNAHHGWNAEHPDLFTNMVENWVSQERLPQELILLHGRHSDALVPA